MRNVEYTQRDRRRTARSDPHTHTQIVDSEKLIQNGRKRFHQILFAKKNEHKFRLPFRTMFTTQSMKLNCTHGLHV